MESIDRILRETNQTPGMINYDKLMRGDREKAVDGCGGVNSYRSWRAWQRKGKPSGSGYYDSHTDEWIVHTRDEALRIKREQLSRQYRSRPKCKNVAFLKKQLQRMKTEADKKRR